MEVQFTPDVEKKLNDLAERSGLRAADLLQDAVVGYLEDVERTRGLLEGRYRDLQAGRVQPIDGEQFFENLKRREDDLLQKTPPR